ncbi:MAG: hypothetical protein AAGA77_19475 [Bacteroidota bacterium]
MRRTLKLFCILLTLTTSNNLAGQTISYLTDDANLTTPLLTVTPCGAGIGSPCNTPSPNTIFVFPEHQEFSLPSTVTMDATAYQTLNNQDLTETTLNVGSCVNSYFLVFNPADNPRAGSFSTKATIRFSTPVIGFIYSSALLYQSHATLGASGTTYPSSTSLGVNYRPNIGFEYPNQDGIQFMDEYTLLIDMTASYPGDQLRVLTSCCGCHNESSDE